MALRRLTLLILSTVMTNGIGIVYATQIANSSIGLASPSFIQTFENPSFTANSLINNSFAQVSSSTLYYDGNNAGGYACAFYEESGNCVTNFTSVPSANGSVVAANVQSTFSLFFTAPETAVAFAMVAGGHDSDTFTAFLKGVQVATFTAVVSSNYTDPGVGSLGNFFGFSDITGGFDQIQVQTTGSNHVVIDNVQMNALVRRFGQDGPTAPEPGTITLLGLGFGGFFALRLHVFRSRRLHDHVCKMSLLP